MPRLKVYILRNSWRHNDYGGAEVMVIDLVSELNSQGVSSTLISGGKSTIIKAKKRKISLIVGPFSNHQVLTKHRGIFLPLYLFDLYRAKKAYIRIFKEHGPDLIHANGQQDCIAATSAAKKLNIPVVWNDHGELKNSIEFKFLPPFGIPGFLLKKQLRNVKALCMVNPEDISFVKSFIVNTPIHTIPNGISHPKFAKSNKYYDLVFASRVIREKGIFELLHAFEQLQKAHNDLTLAVAGNGPSLEKAVALVNLKSIKNIDFIEFNNDIPKGKYFVLPSYTEAQSLTILKAMALNMPVVTTNIDGNTHFLKHKETAYLVEPRDSQSLYEGLQYMLDHEDKAKAMAKKALAQYNKKSSIKTIVKKYYIPLYKKIINLN